ncbi:MAG: hypothetical protein ACREIW_08020, partial [Chthoniobacterales bacterium]
VMLAENPEDRPLDPVVLERYMLTILDEVERRHAFARKVGIPLAAYVQQKIVRSPSRLAQIVRGGIAAAALLIALGRLAQFSILTISIAPGPLKRSESRSVCR